MPFFEVVGSDARTHRPRSLHISARSDQEAIFTAADQGITGIKLRSITDREVLMMDLKCFLNAVPARTNRGSSAPGRIGNQQSAAHNLPRSLLWDHPILTLTVAMLLALSLNRLIETLPILF
ncbi:MAG: hypothetical protein WD114_02535 [Phycisphaerales bacterium]